MRRARVLVAVMVVLTAMGGFFEGPMGPGSADAKPGSFSDRPIRRADSSKTTSTTEPTTTTTSTAEPTATVSTYVFPVTHGEHTLNALFCGNGSLAPDTSVRRLVLVIHGDQRNACGYAGYVVESAVAAEKLAGTLVVAPHFVTLDEVTAQTDNLLYWSDGGWKAGSNSLTSPYERPFRMSSFSVVDEIVATARASFPGLEELVVAGHSAGAQFTNRYAAGSSMAGDSRFVIANPSSYLYVDGRRWTGMSFSLLADAAVAECPRVDDYKYGLQNLYAYARTVGAEALRTQYGQRRVTYLLGEHDTSTTAASLDQSCSASWQGESRFERGVRYHEYLATVYGKEVHDRHRLAVVDDVGHSARWMFTSKEGQEALFGPQTS